MLVFATPLTPVKKVRFSEQEESSCISTDQNRCSALKGDTFQRSEDDAPKGSLQYALRKAAIRCESGQSEETARQADDGLVLSPIHNRPQGSNVVPSSPTKPCQRFGSLGVQNHLAEEKEFESPTKSPKPFMHGRIVSTNHASIPSPFQPKVRSFVPSPWKLPEIPMDPAKLESQPVIPKAHRRFSVGATASIEESVVLVPKQTMSAGRSLPKPKVPHIVPIMAPQIFAINKFAYSKVFQTKYNAAASVIQKRGRVLYARRVLQDLRQAEHERQIQRELLRNQNAAATTIQAVVRCWTVRLNFQVHKLQFQLQRIEESRLRELDEITKWKEAQMTQIQQEYNIGPTNIDPREQQNLEELEKRNKLINYLRKDNARQRAKNAALQIAIDQLLEENHMLNEEATKYANFRELTCTMSKASEDKSMLLAMIEEFGRRKVAYELAIETRDECIMYENRVGRLYLNTIRTIVLLLEDTCEDEYLVYSVEQMCLELEGDRGDMMIDESERCDREMLFANC